MNIRTKERKNQYIQNASKNKKTDKLLEERRRKQMSYTV